MQLCFVTLRKFDFLIFHFLKNGRKWGRPATTETILSPEGTQDQVHTFSRFLIKTVQGATLRPPSGRL